MKKNFVITPFCEKHLNDALAIYNCYVLNTSVTFHTEPLTGEDFRRIVFPEDKRCRAFAITDTGAKILIGYCYIALFRPRQAYRLTGEVSLYLRTEYTGKGIGGAAIERLEMEAKKQGFHAIIAGICGENEASLKLFEGKGYKRVAHMKEVGYKFGRFLDVIYCEKLLGKK